MTQEDAVIRALEELGGKAHQKEIYKLAMKHCTFGGKTPDASIRTILQRSYRVRHSSEKGWWELNSYQEELSLLCRQKEELVAVVEELRRQLALPAIFESIANECMNATQKQNVTQRENMVNLLNAIKAILNISVSAETNERLKQFAAETTGQNGKAVDYLQNINSLMESINERLERAIQKPSIGTLVMEQNNYGAKEKLTGKEKNTKMIEK